MYINQSKTIFIRKYIFNICHLMIKYWTLGYSKLFFAIISWQIRFDNRMLSMRKLCFPQVIHTKFSNDWLSSVSLYSLNFGTVYYLPSFLVSILLWIDRFTESAKTPRQLSAWEWVHDSLTIEKYEKQVTERMIHVKPMHPCYLIGWSCYLILLIWNIH